MLHKTRLALAATTLSLGLVAGSAPAVTALPEWRTTATSHAVEEGTRQRVIDLRHAVHRRFDRVVVDLKGLRPGYRVSYTKRLAYEGSGHPIRLPGRKKMSLTIYNAYGHDRSGRSIYEGPRRVTPDFPTLRGIAFAGDFEGHVTFGFGLARRAPYRVFVLHHPTRLVLDWKH